LDTVLQNPRLKLLSAPSATWTYLGMNCDDPLLRDVRVRRAVVRSIDRAGIVASKFRGHAVLSSSMLAPSNWAHVDLPGAYAYDPAEARALLREAGAIGAPIVLKVSAASKFRLAIARVLASELSAAGFDAEVRAYEFGTFFGDVKRGNVQLFLLQLPEVTEPDYLHAFFHSSQIPRHEDPDIGTNRFRHRDAQIDRWLDEARGIEDREERRRIYAEVQRRLAETVPAVPLWHEDNLAVLQRSVMGYVLWPNARFSSLAGVWKEGR
jgi:peptide/nickel transport system substrate-binding protein